ncbi:hypothetical protein EGW08_017160 [Elysia chlorotica]|uniref:Uncharacterized protein n=1 Tax=Elysia chlorotica TaxID=188477 RepID=A0A3S1B970_ELYCH|nr:hypothetical protein EGW08_017160 [Elysia chlorotica]
MAPTDVSHNTSHSSFKYANGQKKVLPPHVEEVLHAQPASALRQVFMSLAVYACERYCCACLYSLWSSFPEPEVLHAQPASALRQVSMSLAVYADSESPRASSTAPRTRRPMMLREWEEPESSGKQHSTTDTAPHDVATVNKPTFGRARRATQHSSQVECDSRYLKLFEIIDSNPHGKIVFTNVMGIEGHKGKFKIGKGFVIDLLCRSSSPTQENTFFLLGDNRSLLECADFSGLKWKLEDLDISLEMRTLLFSLA